MQKGNDYEKSPFSIKKYGGAVSNKNTIAYHPTKEFKKELESFFVDVFGDDISKNDAMDIIVKDYFYRYSYKSKGYYGKTLIALISKRDLDEMYERNNEYYLRIVPITVVDRYASNPYGIGNGDLVNADIVDSFEDFGALIYYTSYSNADFSLQETIKNNCAGKLYAPLEDSIVLEIALNNNLDANVDNIYGFENTGDGSINPHLHVGVNIANIGGYGLNAFGIIYYWYLDHDFNVQIEDIKLVSNHDLNSLLLESKYCSLKTQEVLMNLIKVGTDLKKRLDEKLGLKKDLESYLENVDDEIERIKLAIEMDNKNNNDKSL